MFPFFTISLEIRNQATWYQAHCCFLIFSYILTLFFEKNRIFENIEFSWAIDFAVFAFWMKRISNVIFLRRRITLDCLNFFTISLEIRNQATWYQAHCCFLIFSYILTLFFEKNRIFENIEISWAIDFAVFAFWMKRISNVIFLRRRITLDCLNFEMEGT
ncbi:hypothetical protein T01_2667 [Trichinella spiralis]|uniref:Uncharacterized protein n=1 Tax=Trichinella spiralis TaxID=6334 RepID=A0A0V1BA31_TRISP|nr:hypothetical protein T01_2667 [Trichinella spiralis]